MIAQASQAQGLRVRDERTQDASAGRKRSDFRHQFGLDPNGHELRQGRSILVQDTEGGIAGPRHGGGLFDDVTQQNWKVEVPFNEQDGF